MCTWLALSSIEFIFMNEQPMAHCWCFIDLESFTFCVAYSKRYVKDPYSRLTFEQFDGSTKNICLFFNRRVKP